MIRYIFSVLIDALFPPRCFLCNKLITPEYFCCPECEKELFPVDAKICTLCGLPKKECECKKFIYYFDGIIAPFYNSGVTKDSFYRYKFKRNRRIGKFYSLKMADFVKKHYKDISFDFITSVPKSRFKKFNHSKLLAINVSNSCGIPFLDVLTITDKQRVTQHKLGMLKRFSNVRDTYKVVGNVKNKNILLVDDIKTTGATISECARMLKLSGANSVYCVTALISKAYIKH